MARIAPNPVNSCARLVTEVADLVTLYEKEVQIVIWRRSIDEQVASFAANVLRRDENLRILEEVAVADLDRFELLPPRLKALDAAGAAAFGDDLRMLCRIAADLLGATHLGLRLLRLTSAMCPRFHTDYVGARLLTTYAGVGTEWLEEASVDRRFLGHRAKGIADERSGMLRPGAAPQQVPELAVALLKGEAWPGNRGRGAVHRSPSLQTGARVLFSIDVLAQEGGFDGFDRDDEGRAAPRRRRRPFSAGRGR
jgi:hypothetical protein